MERQKKNTTNFYDLMYKAGIGIHKMRIDEPFGDTAKAGLKYVQSIRTKNLGKSC